MKSQIEKFKIRGDVYIWSYKDNQRNYPGWNLTTDRTASESLNELLSLMNQCEWSTKKTLLTKTPTELQLKVPNNQNGLTKWISKPKITLNSKKTQPENYWLVNQNEEEIEIQFGKGKLIELQKAISGITKGIGDFAISDSNEENILYFWWSLKK